MFVPNKQHLQGQIFTTIDALPQHLAKRLEESWAAVFYREYFCRIDEQAYAVLYSEKDSRPNIPVNVLVSLEALKSGSNWSDEEMYDAFCFDLQVRRALGYVNLHEGQFDLRTVYNFRHRLGQYMQETGENLIDKSFEQTTDEQIKAFMLKTGKIRMDSTNVASNIRNMSRLHLLVEIIQRVHRMLSEGDRELYADAFAPYVKGTSGQYVYRVKSADGQAHMQKIGELMQELLEKLAGAYGQHATYRMLERVFAEHFLVEQSRLRLKVGKELSSRSLNSPDDPEATYREKNNRPYKGYVSNVSETCDPSNPMQLIVLVQTKPNVTNDDDMLIEAVPLLKERLGVDEINADGGYNSDESFKLLRDNDIKLIQTAIRGHSPHEHLGLDKFEIVMSSAANNAPDGSLTTKGDPDAASQPDGSIKSAGINETSSVNEPCVPGMEDVPNEMGETYLPHALAVAGDANSLAAINGPSAADECHATSEPCACSAPEVTSQLAESAERYASSLPDLATNAAANDEPDSAGESQVGNACAERYASSLPDLATNSAASDEPDSASEPQVANAAPAAVGTPAADERAPAQAPPMTITCPHGQTVKLESVDSSTEYKRYRAHFDAGQCGSCPFKDKCLARETKTKRWRTLSFDERDVEIARRRRRIEEDRRSGTNLRVPIESTIGSLKQPFNYDQLPVRGQFRIGMVMIGCAVMANIRRIHRYISGKRTKDLCESFLLLAMAVVARLLGRLYGRRQPVLTTLFSEDTCHAEPQRSISWSCRSFARGSR